jgi:hypothetical protein
MTNSTVSFMVEIIGEMLENKEIFRRIDSDLSFDYYTIHEVEAEIEERLGVSIYSHSNIRLLLHKEEKTIKIHRSIGNKIDGIHIYTRND